MKRKWLFMLLLISMLLLTSCSGPAADILNYLAEKSREENKERFTGESHETEAQEGGLGREDEEWYGREDGRADDYNYGGGDYGNDSNDGSWYGGEGYQGEWDYGEGYGDWDEDWFDDWYRSESYSVSRKDLYTEFICETIATVPLEPRTSSLRQADIDGDTLQWLNATYAIFSYSGKKDYTYVGGYSDENSSVRDNTREQLKESWGITNKWTALESLLWLAEEGHAWEYDETIRFMYWCGLIDCGEEELKGFLDELYYEGWDAEEVEGLYEYYTTIRSIHGICGENGIDAWDYCRIMQLCGGCYVAGYFTLEECLTIQLAVAQVIQQQFGSWEAMADSYFYGYSYWTFDSYLISLRRQAYEDMLTREDSPFQVLDFYMELEKFW